MYIKKVTVLECSNNISCLTYPQGQLWPDMASFGLVPSTTFVVKNGAQKDIHYVNLKNITIFCVLPKCTITKTAILLQG